MERRDKPAVLIVDDRPANIMALENILSVEDRIIYTASNGKDALTIVLNKEIDLIILDVQMPDMDGFEVAGILKSNKRTKDIPIIFASAEKTEHEFMMKGYEEGAIDYLFKPLDPEVAKAKVNILLKIQLQKKELMEKNFALQRSALLIENSADIIGIVDAATLKVEEVNNAFSSILGYKRDEALGMPLSFFLSNEDRQNLVELSKKNKEQLSFEARIYCKNRSIKWLQCKVVVKFGKWFVNARDITELKVVERIKNYVTTVVKQSKDAIYIHDHEGKIISWNEGATEIYGYTEKEALNMKIWNIIPEYIKPDIDEMLHKVLSGEKILDLETKRITKRGKLINVLFSASVIDDSSSQQKSIAITERDITQQKIADDKIKQLNKDLQDNVVQLETINKELESFSYSVSHDLRAPLRALNQYSNIIEEDHGTKLDDDVKGLFSKIKYNAKRMEMLIDDLLAFSRIGRAGVKKNHVNMANLVECILRDIQGAVKYKAQIKTLELPSIDGDESLLTQVWVNLISNAIKYSSKKDAPLVEIGSTQTENEVIYHVRDNGVGFNMEYANKLFKVFQRLHTTKDFEGTGVGLAIVQKIVAKHDGRIWAEAKENEGATFYFAIPHTEIQSVAKA